MSERPFMQLYVSDFIGDTLSLSTEQIGAYMLLLMAMWNAGGVLPDDEKKLARIVRMSIKKWRGISDEMMDYFVRADGIIWHDRLTKELQKSDRKSESRASAGAKGGTAKALKNKEAMVTNAKQTPKHLPDTITREKELANASSKKPTPRSELEQVLSPEIAEAVIEHRQRIRKPMTAHGAKLLAGQLAKWHDPDEAANEMIANGWQGFKPEYLENRQSRGQPPPRQERMTPSRYAALLAEGINPDERNDPDENQDHLRLVGSVSAVR